MSDPQATAYADMSTVNVDFPPIADMMQTPPAEAEAALRASGLPVVHQPRQGFQGIGPVKLQQIAEMMADAGPMVPPAFQAGIVGREIAIGRCKAVAYQADRWGLDPVAVCGKAYPTLSDFKLPDGTMVKAERIGWEAQLVNAVILALAPIRGRPVYRYGYQGNTHTAPFRFCHIEATTRDGQVLPMTTPTIAQIRVKNSPLWFSDPDQQLGYYGIRALARRHFPDVLLGVYTREELAVIEVREVGERRSHFDDDDAPPPVTPVDAEFTDAEAEAAWGGKPETTADQLQANKNQEERANNSASRDPRDAEENQRQGGNQSRGRAPAPPPAQGGLEHDTATSDRDAVMAGQSRVLATKDTGAAATEWAQVRASKEWGRVKTYQPDIAKAVTASVNAHAQRLREAAANGADPETGEVQ